MSGTPRCASAALAVLAAAVLVSPTSPAVVAAPLPAGTTAAVLSFIDAASGAVEIVRHWPDAPTDVVVRPFVPYAWDGCPGPGAIMVLLVGPGADDVAIRAAEVVNAAMSSGPAGLRDVAAGLRTPGDAAFEAIKAAAPIVSDLATYERDGYAVFLFVHGAGVVCAATVAAVPEGYAIPLVR